MIRIIAIVWLLMSSAWAGKAPEMSWYSEGPNDSIELNVELFLSSECTHCYNANEFFKILEPQNPWLHVHRHFINKDKSALALFSQLLAQQNMDDFAVPSIYICGARWVGFANIQTTGEQLFNAISYCRNQIIKNGQLTTSTIDILKNQAYAAYIDATVKTAPRASYYILVVAFLDAITPCALFWFMGLVGFLLIEPDKSKHLRLGLCYIIIGLFIHWYQQVQMSNAFEWLIWARIPAAIAGLIGSYLIYARWLHNLKSSMILTVASIFSVLVMFYQQTCQMNWSNVFEQWVRKQDIDHLQWMIYHIAYQLAFAVIPILILLILRWLLSSSWFDKNRRFLGRCGITILFSISLLLIVYPSLLSNSLYSIGILLFSICGSWLFGLVKK